MRSSLSIKTLFRAPVKTILTFILIAVITFMLFSQTAEYAITEREVDRASQQYKGTGYAMVEAVEDTDPGGYDYFLTDPRMRECLGSGQKEYYNELRYPRISNEQIEAISNLPYITTADKRYMTAGISDTYTRMEENYGEIATSGFNYFGYTQCYVVEGTFRKSTTYSEGYSYELAFDDYKLVSQRPSWYNVMDITGQNFIVTAYASFYGAEGDAFMKDMSDAINSLVPGERYAMLCWVRATEGSDTFNGFKNEEGFDFKGIEYFNLELRNIILSGEKAIWPISGAPENYLETEEYATLKEAIERIDRDKHTFDMVYTKNINAITRFADGRMSVSEGRAITEADVESGAKVCVVSRQFAESNGLKVGDRLTMNIGTELFEQYRGLGALAVSAERYSDELIPTELEIVGIFQDNDTVYARHNRPNWGYSINTIFVPVSLLPLSESEIVDHEFSQTEFSYTVDNAWDIAAFENEAAPLFEELGLKFMFDDGGWVYIENSFKAVKIPSLIKISVISAAAVVAIVFVVYLFITRKRKEFAIMRALGTPRGKATRSLILPLMVITVFAVIAGAAAGWIYAVKSVSKNNVILLLGEYQVNSTVPCWILLVALGEILLTLILAAIQLGSIGRLPPLELLQSGNAGRTRKVRAPKERKRARPVTSPVPPAADKNVPLPDMEGVKRKKAGSFGFVCRYVFRHIRRSGWRAAMSMLLAAVLFIAVGQFIAVKQQYLQMCEETRVSATLLGGPLLHELPSFLAQDFIGEVYYSSKAYSVNVNYTFTNSRIYVTNDVVKFVGDDCEITYADGFDETCMNSLDGVLFATEEAMERLDLKLGDTVYLANLEKSEWMLNEYILYMQENEGLDPNAELTREQYEAALNDLAREYKLAGVVKSNSKNYIDTLFTPGMVAATSEQKSSGIMNFNVEIKLNEAEFYLSDYTKLTEMQEYCKMRAQLNGAYVTIDANKLAGVVSILGVLEKLYPAITTAAVLIGAAVCCLIIVQHSKEAAIMRALGTTKRKSRMLLSSEQIILAITGIIAGIILLFIIKASSVGAIFLNSIVFAAMYGAAAIAASIICAVIVTRRSVLELLQTKE